MTESPDVVWARFELERINCWVLDQRLKMLWQSYEQADSVKREALFKVLTAEYVALQAIAEIRKQGSEAAE